MMLGLAILNPVYFLCMMIGASKTIPVTLSVLFGTILGPIIYLLSPEWSILLAGIIGGTIAYLAREAEIRYASVSMVTDYDCWHPDHENVLIRTRNAKRRQILF